MNDNPDYSAEILDEMLQILKDHRRTRATFTKDDPIRKEKTIPGGVAAFHALHAISLRDDHVNRDSDHDDVEVPQWVFGELLSAWKIFLLLGSADDDRKTFGQVMGCEATFQGGREGAKLAKQKWDEVRYVALMNHLRRICQDQGIKVSNEELVGVVADLSDRESFMWPSKSDATLRRYIENKFKKP